MVLRVFPGRTKATPDDEGARFGPPGLFEEADEIHISVTFTWHRELAEQLGAAWERIAPVKIGGVGWRTKEQPFGDPGAEFVPGRYVKRGYVFTSRGCPRKCKFCSVPLRDPLVRLLPIVDGWNILDDNLLACPRRHVEAVFSMLKRQKRRVEFTGGLEAKSLKDYQVGLLADLSPPPSMFWAYDPGDPFETLKSAADRMWAAGLSKKTHRVRCYVLIGFPAEVSEDERPDTFEAAERRLEQMVSIGFTPMAMLYRPEIAGNWRPDPEWRRFQRRWARPAIIHARQV